MWLEDKHVAAADEPGVGTETRRSPLVLLGHHRMIIRDVGAAVDLVGKRLHHALDERRQREDLIEIRRHVAHADFDGAEIVVRTNVPPDLANRVDEYRSLSTSVFSTADSGLSDSCVGSSCGAGV